MASPDATSSPAPPRTPWGLFVPILVILLAGAGYLGWTAWDRATTPTLAALEQAFNSGETARAERDAEHYLRRHPGDAPALLILAKTRLKHDDYRGAAEALAAVPAASIHKTEALFREGQAWKKLGQGRRARRALTAAVLRDPRGQGPAMNARMELLALFAMEERREAFDALAWETYAALAPENRISVLVMRTRLDYEQTAPDVNAKSLQPFLDADPQDPGALAGLAATRDRQGDLAAAESLYRRAAALDPSDPELRERRLDLLYRLGRSEDFAALLKRTPKADLERPMTLRAQGIERESRGDLEGALDAYTRAVAADPTEPEFHHRRAQVFLRLNRKAEAEAEAAERKRLREAHDDLRKAWDRLGDAWDRDPNRIEPTLLHGMARASERAGRGREAAAWFHQVLLRLPADQEAIAAVERLRPVDPDPPR